MRPSLIASAVTFVKQVNRRNQFARNLCMKKNILNQPVTQRAVKTLARLLNKAIKYRFFLFNHKIIHYIGDLQILLEIRTITTCYL